MASVVESSRARTLLLLLRRVHWKWSLWPSLGNLHVINNKVNAHNVLVQSNKTFSTISILLLLLCQREPEKECARLEIREKKIILTFPFVSVCISNCFLSSLCYKANKGQDERGIKIRHEYCVSREAAIEQMNYCLLTSNIWCNNSTNY